MRKQKKQPTSGLPKARQDTSLVLPAAGRAQADDGQPSKPARQPRRENTGDRPGRMSALSGHSSGLVVRRSGFLFLGLFFLEDVAPPHA